MNENLQKPFISLEEELKKTEQEYRKEIRIIQSATISPSDEVVDYVLKQIHAESKKETPLTEI